MENIHENQVGKVLPYQYEPEVGEKGTNISDESDSDRESDLSSSGEEIDQVWTLHYIPFVATRKR